MRTVKLRKAVDSEIVEGAMLYTPVAPSPQGVGQVFEQVEVTEIREWFVHGPEQSLFDKHPSVRRWSTSVEAVSGWSGGRDPDGLYIEDSKGEDCLTYERTGTAVMVRMLVSEDDSGEAVRAVEALLDDADCVVAVDELHPRPAFDKADHYLTRDGHVIAADVPHWSLRGMTTPTEGVGIRSTVPATVPVNEAVRMLLVEQIEESGMLVAQRRGKRKRQGAS